MDMSNAFMSIAQDLIMEAMREISPKENWLLLEERLTNLVVEYVTVDGLVHFVLEHG